MGCRIYLQKIALEKFTRSSRADGNADPTHEDFQLLQEYDFNKWLPMCIRSWTKRVARDNNADQSKLERGWVGGTHQN